MQMGIANDILFPFLFQTRGLTYEALISTIINCRLKATPPKQTSQRVRGIIGKINSIL